MVDNNNDQSLINKEYTLDLNNIQYKVNISIINKNKIKSILFTIGEINLIRSYYYTSDFSLDEMKNINKNFRKFDTIEEAFEELNDLFFNKKVSLQIESNEIIIHLNIQNLSASKTDIICLKVAKKYFKKEEINESIIKEINQIKEKNLFLEQKVKTLEEKNEVLLKTIEELKNSLNEISENQKNKEKYNINSEIFNGIDEVKLVYDRLITKGIFKDKNPKFQLIYRASRDGSNVNIYKNKILGIKNFLCVLQTKKGCKFGGYTEAAPDYSKGYINDENAFIFSLDKRKIYNYLENNASVGFFDGNGPNFCYGFCVQSKDFFIGDDNSVCNKKDSRFYYQDKDYEINNYENKFIINDLEVFQVI